MTARNPDLRVLGRSQGFGERPVGFPGIQQGADAVVVEVGEPEGTAFDAFWAALVILALCQFEIWVRQVHRVRPSRLISSGSQGSWKSSASWLTVSAPTFGSVMA